MNQSEQSPANEHIAIFRKKEIRRVIYRNEWWFVITDVVVALTDSTNPSQYLKNMRNRDTSFDQLFAKGGGFKLNPPLPWGSTQLGVSKNSFAGTPKRFFV